MLRLSIIAALALSPASVGAATSDPSQGFVYIFRGTCKAAGGTYSKASENGWKELTAYSGKTLKDARCVDGGIVYAGDWTEAGSGAAGANSIAADVSKVLVKIAPSPTTASALGSSGWVSNTVPAHPTGFCMYINADVETAAAVQHSNGAPDATKDEGWGVFILSDGVAGFAQSTNLDKGDKVSGDSNKNVCEAGMENNPSGSRFEGTLQMFGASIPPGFTPSPKSTTGTAGNTGAAAGIAGDLSTHPYVETANAIDSPTNAKLLAYCSESSQLVVRIKAAAAPSKPAYGDWTVGSSLCNVLVTASALGGGMGLLACNSGVAATGDVLLSFADHAKLQAGLKKILEYTTSAPTFAVESLAHIRVDSMSPLDKKVSYLAGGGVAGGKMAAAMRTRPCGVVRANAAGVIDHKEGHKSTFRATGKFFDYLESVTFAVAQNGTKAPQLKRNGRTTTGGAATACDLAMTGIVDANTSAKSVTIPVGCDAQTSDAGLKMYFYQASQDPASLILHTAVSSCSYAVFTGYPLAKVNTKKGTFAAGADLAGCLTVGNSVNYRDVGADVAAGASAKCQVSTSEVNADILEDGLVTRTAKNNGTSGVDDIAWVSDHPDNGYLVASYRYPLRVAFLYSAGVATAAALSPVTDGHPILTPKSFCTGKCFGTTDAQPSGSGAGPQNLSVLKLDYHAPSTTGTNLAQGYALGKPPGAPTTLTSGAKLKNGKTASEGDPCFKLPTAVKTSLLTFAWSCASDRPGSSGTIEISFCNAKIDAGCSGTFARVQAFLVVLAANGGSPQTNAGETWYTPSVEILFSAKFTPTLRGTKWGTDAIVAAKGLNDAPTTKSICGALNGLSVSLKRPVYCESAKGGTGDVILGWASPKEMDEGLTAMQLKANHGALFDANQLASIVPTAYQHCSYAPLGCAGPSGWTNFVDLQVTAEPAAKKRKATAATTTADCGEAGTAYAWCANKQETLAGANAASAVALRPGEYEVTGTACEATMIDLDSKAAYCNAAGKVVTLRHTTGKACGFPAVASGKTAETDPLVRARTTKGCNPWLDSAATSVYPTAADNIRALMGKGQAKDDGATPKIPDTAAYTLDLKTIPLARIAFEWTAGTATNTPKGGAMVHAEQGSFFLTDSVCKAVGAGSGAVACESTAKGVSILVADGVGLVKAVVRNISNQAAPLAGGVDHLKPTEMYAVADGKQATAATKFVTLIVNAGGFGGWKSGTTLEFGAAQAKKGVMLTTTTTQKEAQSACEMLDASDMLNAAALWCEEPASKAKGDVTLLFEKETDLTAATLRDTFSKEWQPGKLSGAATKLGADVRKEIFQPQAGQLYSAKYTTKVMGTTPAAKSGRRLFTDGVAYAAHGKPDSTNTVCAGVENAATTVACVSTQTAVELWYSSTTGRANGMSHIAKLTTLKGETPGANGVAYMKLTSTRDHGKASKSAFALTLSLTKPAAAGRRGRSLDAGAAKNNWVAANHVATTAGSACNAIVTAAGTGLQMASCDSPGGAQTVDATMQFLEASHAAADIGKVKAEHAGVAPPKTNTFVTTKYTLTLKSSTATGKKSTGGFDVDKSACAETKEKSQPGALMCFSDDTTMSLVYPNVDQAVRGGQSMSAAVAVTTWNAPTLVAAESTKVVVTIVKAAKALAKSAGLYNTAGFCMDVSQLKKTSEALAGTSDAAKLIKCQNDAITTGGTVNLFYVNADHATKAKAAITAALGSSGALKTWIEQGSAAATAPAASTGPAAATPKPTQAPAAAWRATVVGLTLATAALMA